MIKYFMENYSTVQQPRNGSHPLWVKVIVRVSNVLDVDILRYTMSSVLLLNQSWYDHRLQWNRTEYPYSAITVPWNSVWTPSFVIREAHVVEWKDSSPQVKIHSNGWMYYCLPLRIDSNCNFELFHYPEDLSECLLSFFSLLDSELMFDVSVENEIENVKHEYHVTRVTIQVSAGFRIPGFTMKLKIKHTPVKTVLSLVVPSFAVLVADMFGFLLPILDNERISFKITLLLGYMVFHSSLVDALPGASACNPLLIYLFNSILLLLFISMIETLIVTRLASEDLPLWMRWRIWLCFGLGRGQSAQREAKEKVTETENREENTNRRRHRQTFANKVDRLFFIIYLAICVLFHSAFVGVWLSKDCFSEPPPRKP
ncbi:zinc-activated ligand-gated ion channel [Rhinatrema bivittatum]|uniref:zinc-activated ligand-gated ion channel n=1 Tax=Rhinatrema bivittatum TaxID=194408 RepID=UPI00112AEEE7|nr:zinc-activated ligand-gated ion channel [Rhinatrema bivittatum]